MEKKRPQLSLHELHQLRWLLGGGLAAVSCVAVLYLDVDAWTLLAICGLLVPAFTLWPRLPGKLPPFLDRLAFPGIVVWFCADVYLLREPLPAMVRLDLLLILYRVISYRKRRDDLQLIVLGLFLVVVAGVLTVSIGFVVQILAFVGLALGLLLIRTLVDELEAAEGSKPAAARDTPGWAHPDWGRLARKVAAAMDLRVLMVWTMLFAGLVACSGFLFLAIPRFQLDRAFFFDRLLTRKSVTGFTDTLRFGDVSDIQKDDGIAVRIDVSDRSRLPKELYWRMVVMDEYRDRSFVVSTALRANAFAAERTIARINGSEVPAKGEPLTWTFYLEPGVSRYLPLLGPFRRMSFPEPQQLSVSSSLQIFALGREPTSMKAYRVEGMNGEGGVRDLGTVARRRTSWFGDEGHRAVKAPTMLELPLNEADRAQLDGMVKTIRPDGPQTMDAATFAREAGRWLGRHHGYSLQMQLPAGTGDPLVRWMGSDQPGHCELFAGALVFLSRAAGYPARVVGGFLGGTWNEDYLILRNSDAHAWCELYDGKGWWFRVDPTASAGGAEGSAVKAGDATANLRMAEGGWGSRIDRLRVLWYRRVVNFNQNDQVEIAQALKDSAQNSGRQMRALLDALVERVRAWAQGPWKVGRQATVAGLLALPLAMWGWWIWLGRSWWWRWRSARAGARTDPIRREAGKWLVRVRTVDTRTAVDRGVVEEQLMRLRYGPKETWPDAGQVFRGARRVARRVMKEE